MSATTQSNENDPADFFIVLAIVTLLLLIMNGCASFRPVEPRDYLSVTFTDIESGTTVSLMCDSAVHRKDYISLYSNGLEQKIRANSGVIINISKHR